MKYSVMITNPSSNSFFFKPSFFLSCFIIFVFLVVLNLHTPFVTIIITCSNITIIISNIIINIIALYFFLSLLLRLLRYQLKMA